MQIYEVTTTGASAFTYIANWDTIANNGTIPSTSIDGGKDGFIEVRFKPTAATLYTAELTVKNNAANEPTKTWAISGRAVDPHVDGGASDCYPCRKTGVKCLAEAQNACCSNVCKPDGTCQ